MKTANNTGSIEECLRCGHKWMSKVKYPKRCPNCTSPYWSKPKTVFIPHKPDPGPTLAVLTEKLDPHPIVNIPPRLYNQLKSHLSIAMRDKYPKIEFELKGNEIIEIL